MNWGGPGLEGDNDTRTALDIRGGGWGQSSLVMTGISYRVASAKEGPGLTGKVGQKRSSAELASQPPSMGGGWVITRALELRHSEKRSLPALSLKHHCKRAGPWKIWPEGVITHIATANPYCSELQRDSPGP